MTEPTPATQYTPGPGRRPIPIEEWPTYCQANRNEISVLKLKRELVRQQLGKMIGERLACLDLDVLIGLAIDAGVITSWEATSLTRDLLEGDEPTIEPEIYTEEVGI